MFHEQSALNAGQADITPTFGEFAGQAISELASSESKMLYACRSRHVLDYLTYMLSTRPLSKKNQRHYPSKHQFIEPSHIPSTSIPER